MVGEKEMIIGGAKPETPGEAVVKITIPFPHAASELHQHLVRAPGPGERACADHGQPVRIASENDCRHCEAGDPEPTLGREPFCPVCSYCCGC